MISSRKLSFFILAVVCASCAPIANVRQRTLAQDERDVLMAVITDDSEAESAGASMKMIVIESMTTPVEPEWLPDAEIMREEAEVRFPMEAFSDLERRSDSPRPVLDLLGDSAIVRVITVAQRNALDSAGGGVNGPFNRFQKLYPGARSILFLSRAGFDESRTHAAVHLGFWCGSLCGAAGVVLLEYRNGSWRVVDRVGMMIS